MQKKVFLQKNLRKGGGGVSSPYLKYLLLAAVGLIALVLVTPYLLKQKGREVAKKPIPEKGQLLKELPKPPETVVQELPREMAKPAEPAPAEQPPQMAQPAAQPPQTLPAVPVQSEASPPAAKAPAAEKATQAARPTEQPKDLFPKKGAPAAPTAPGSQGQKTAANAKAPSQIEQNLATRGAAPNPAVPGVAPKPPAAGAGKQRYVVQVGCFKEKGDAETVQRGLAKKGYDVILCSSSPSGGGTYAYTVMTKPIDNLGKASTLAEQMRNEGKASPTVIKLPAEGCDIGSGPPPPAKKPQARPKPQPQAKPGGMQQD